MNFHPRILWANIKQYKGIVPSEGEKIALQKMPFQMVPSRETKAVLPTNKFNRTVEAKLPMVKNRILVMSNW
jgi:hypothetical protein